MGKKIDLTGQKFGRLTVLERAENDNRGKTRWLCRCECGNEKIISRDNLISGHTQSCGCYNIDTLVKRHKGNSLVGQRFGKLVVLVDDGTRDKRQRIMYKCQCDCGTITYAAATDLRIGTKKSCGCLASHDFRKRVKIGEVYGRLTVLEKTDRKQQSFIIYKCQCQCGNIIEVTSHNLKSGHTKSCGCLKSLGEARITTLLRDNGIQFQSEKRFDDCKDKRPLPFDFYIENLYVIEYDGSQHYECDKNHGWNDISSYLQTQKHDKIKNDYCKEHDIPIIRIPYTHKNICLEDLLLETSKFII